VRFHAPVPHAELLRYVAGAWCGFSLLVDSCTNHRWSLPNKLFECIAAGVPVIVSDNPEIAAFVDEQGVGETCDPTDPASIAAAVGRLAKRHDVARDAALLAAGRYRWVVEKEQLTELYRMITGPVA
jgi:glycosyltransferase involved in cell wall biosynthesis